MDENLYRPLQMTTTSMVWEPRFESDYANGYDEYGRSLGPEKRSRPDAAGSMQTTSQDYSAFLSAVIRRKTLNTPDSVLGVTSFPFDWEGYTPYNLLPALPKLKEHKRVSLTPAQLNRRVGRYVLPLDVVLTVTVENGRLFIQENDEPKQEFLPESGQDFYSAASGDECSFKPGDEGPAQIMVLHLGGKDVELKRLP